MKHLPKHLRPRWRYLAVAIETWADGSLDESAVQAAFWDAARALLGDPGSADVRLDIVRFTVDAGGGTILVRVRRGEVDRGRAAIACVDAVDDHPVGLEVVGVSGTIRAAEEKYMNAPAGPGDEERVVFQSAAHRAVHRADGRYDIYEAGEVTGATELDLE
ncbi:MAG: Rpp14/Pop5 family protein [Halobacteriaceae archaeon]